MATEPSNGPADPLNGPAEIGSNPFNARYAPVPFREAEAFFRQKLNVPTDRWTDVYGRYHDQAFMVAGAAKAELLQDLREAVRRAIEEGTTLEDFRKEFDAVVDKYGWRYRGMRDWRTYVIYSTNLRTAWAAGRYEQMTSPEERASRPYWLYRHGRPKRPRPDHLSWDGLVLPADDVWWKEHYPPNGWGCTCKAFSMSRRDLEARGLKVTPRAPEDGRYDWKNPSTGETLSLPSGVQPGWNYAPGASWAELHRQKLESFEADLAAENVAELVDSNVFARWFSKHAVPKASSNLKSDAPSAVEFFPVGVLDAVVREAIGARQQLVLLSAETLAKQVRAHAELTLDEYRLLPAMISRGMVIQDGERTVVIFYVGARRYMLAVKTTGTGLTNLITTLHRVDEAGEVERLVRKGTIIREQKGL